MAHKRWISIRNIIIYLETAFRPNRRIFVFWRPFLVQNVHHSKPRCCHTVYHALRPVNIHLH